MDAVLPCRTLAEMAAATSVHVVAVIEPIIQHADWFFPEGEWLCSCADGKAGHTEAFEGQVAQSPSRVRT